MIDCEQIYSLFWIRESDGRCVSLGIAIIDVTAQPPQPHLVFKKGSRNADHNAGATARVDKESKMAIAVADRITSDSARGPANSMPSVL